MEADESVNANPFLKVILAEARKIFGDSEVGPHDNFFALGGTSLDGVELATRLESEYGLKVGVTDLFAAETLAGIAEVTRQG